MNIRNTLFSFLFFFVFFSTPACIIGQIFADNIIPINIESSLKSDLITIDVNGDGDIDIIHSGQELVLYQNMGNFVFENKGTIYDGSLGRFGFHDIVDFNNDGLEDLFFSGVSQDYSSMNISVLISNGNGTFSLELVQDLDLLVDQPRIAVGDFNNDGDCDFILVREIDQLIEWYDNNGDEFEVIQVQNIEGIISVQSVDLVDLNNNTFLDLVINYVYLDPNIKFYENDTQGNFLPPQIVFDGAGIAVDITVPKFGDYDNDGDNDVFLAVEGTDSFGLVRNENDFSDFMNFANKVVPQIWALEIGDVDGDANIDIILGGTNGMNQELGWFSNDGAGEHEYSLINNNIGRPCTIKLFDLNNDSFDDLLISYRDEYNSGDLKYGIIPNISSNSHISGCVFFDENQNGRRDTSEQNIDITQISIESENLLLNTNEDGCYTFFLDDGVYTITPVIPSSWELTSDSVSYTVTIAGNSVSDLDFGISPTEQLLAGQMHAVSGITRCNRETRFDFIFQNVGTTIITEGIVWAFPDDLVSLASELNPIDTIGFTGEWGWTFENLLPGQTIKRSLLLNIPGLGGDVEPGTLIKIFSATEAKDTQDFVNFFKNNFESEILCAYDPNDKLVNPDIEGDENYTQFKDTMIYTVRFQNTGNDTAFTVVIRDTLDQNLDVSTFNILASSHREVLQTQILEDRFVAFSFEDILLPDSTIDFIGSQGYVSYSIEPKDGLEENTIIENTASIFFDFNPPIVTNTTLNTMVECLPIPVEEVTVIIEAGESHTLPDGTVVMESGAYVTDILDDDNCPIETIITTLEVLTSTSELPWDTYVNITPNPANGFVCLDIESSTSISHVMVIYNITGEKIHQQNISSKSNHIELSNFSSGMYLLHLISKEDEVLAVKKLVVH